MWIGKYKAGHRENIKERDKLLGCICRERFDVWGNVRQNSEKRFIERGEVLTVGEELVGNLVGEKHLTQTHTHTHK